MNAKRRSNLETAIEAGSWDGGIYSRNLHIDASDRVSD